MDVAHNYDDIFMPSSFHLHDNGAEYTSKELEQNHAPDGHITFPQLIDIRLPVPNDNRGNLITDNDISAEWSEYGP